MEKLEPEEIKSALQAAPGWRLVDGKLVREWVFADFVQAVAFVNRISVIAEEAGHHPDIDIRYNRVKLGLITHDAGGITRNDAEMAALLSREIDA